MKKFKLFYKKYFTKAVRQMLMLLVLTILFQGLYFIFFKDRQYVYFTILHGVVEAPFNMFLTGVLFNYILNRKEQSSEREKTNMLIGIFYSEVGNELLRLFLEADMYVEYFRSKFMIKKTWTEADYKKLLLQSDSIEHSINIENIDLSKLREKLANVTGLSIDLLTSTSLQNKDDFNIIVNNVFFLKGELDDRMEGRELDEHEKVHIQKIVNELYLRLIKMWVSHMYYRQSSNEQLFIKALIKSPFDNRSRAEKDQEFLEINRVNIKKLKDCIDEKG